VQTLDAAPQCSYGSYTVTMEVMVVCTKGLCSFYSYEESYHTSSCGACPAPEQAVRPCPGSRCGAARGHASEG